MAEVYVDVARLNAADTLLAELEVTTDAAADDAAALDAAVTDALEAKQSAEAVLESKLNLLFLVGC